jgi:thiol-disulfide isomerase/thioredoxin
MRLALVLAAAILLAGAGSCLGDVPAPAAPGASAPAPAMPAKLPLASEMAGRKGLITSGEFAPDFTLPRLDAAGGTFTLSKVIGPKKTGAADGAIVTFMASWCGICQRSLPSLKALTDEHGARLALVVISTDASDDAARKEAAALAAAGLAVPVVRGDAATLAAWLGGETGVPKYFFVNRSGEVLMKDTGYGAKVAGMMPRQLGFTLSHPDPIAR